MEDSNLELDGPDNETTSASPPTVTVLSGNGRKRRMPQPTDDNSLSEDTYSLRGSTDDEEKFSSFESEEDTGTGTPGRKPLLLFTKCTLYAVCDYVIVPRAK